MCHPGGAEDWLVGKLNACAQLLGLDCVCVFLTLYAPCYWSELVRLSENLSLVNMTRAQQV